MEVGEEREKRAGVSIEKVETVLLRGRVLLFI